MLHCDIKGCHAWVSEIFSPQEAAKWFIVRPEQVNEAKQLALIAESERSFGTRTEKLLGRWLGKTAHVQQLETVWPGLDWQMMGGVEKITLCPRHKLEVASEICFLRSRDSSMNPKNPTPGNHS